MIGAIVLCNAKVSSYWAQVHGLESKERSPNPKMLRARNKSSIPLLGPYKGWTCIG